MINIVSIFEKEVKLNGSQAAIISWHKKKQIYEAVSFQQLHKLVNNASAELSSQGLTKSMRVLMGIKPSLQFVVYTLALLKMAAIPVFIDSGMTKKSIIDCINKVKPDAVLGGGKFQLICWLFCRIKPSLRFNSDKIVLTAAFNKETEIQQVNDQQLAAIIFTSGSTGPAKGVEYLHSTFVNQVKIIKDIYYISNQDRDLSIFPLFAVLAVIMGMTSIIPNVDMAYPAKISCKYIYELIEQQKISFSFGSPTFWQNMADFCISNNLKLTSLRTVVMAGCSVPTSLHNQLLNKILSENAQCYVPYGATEALPIVSFSGSQALQDTAQLTDQGYGTCVGELTSNEFIIKIISITDESIERWSDDLTLLDGEIGEICVKGPTVTAHYFENIQADLRAKIRDGQTFWHRMGDVGYFDKAGRLWFCGRKADIVRVNGKQFYTDQCENIFNHLDGIKRTALVESSRYGAVLFVETKGFIKETQLETIIKKQAQKYQISLCITKIIFKNNFPVDVRHNAKIKRDILKLWLDNQ